MEMSPEELEATKKMILEMCLCKNCPTYVDCGEPGGYCFVTIGKSGCISEEKGCLCPSCPVTAKMGLKHMYYCIRGSEKEQLAKD